MPKYKVKTDQGTYSVELDREPASPDELNSIVAQHLGGQAQAPVMQEPEPPMPQSSLPTKPPERTMSAGEVATGAITNIPSSAVQFGKNIYEAVRHPIDTATAVGKIAVGGLNKGAEALGMEPTSRENIPAFDAFINIFKERYGDTEKLKKTIHDDPVGFASDVSTLLSGGAALAGKAGLTGTSKVAKTAAAVTDPINVVKNTGRLATKVIPEKVPQKLYASAAKLSTAMKPAKRAEIIKTALDEGILPTHKGIEKLNSVVDDLNAAIDDTIVGAARRGEAINADDIVRRLDELRPTFQNQALPADDLAVLDAAKEGFRAAHGQVIPVERAQEIKKGTYAILRKKYGQLSDARTEAEKSIARGIKEELASRYPELKDLNAREGKLLELNKAVERAVSRIENLNLIGIGTPITGGAGALITDSGKGGLYAAAAKAIIDNPKMKSWFAVQLHQARTKGLSLKKTGKQKAAAAAFQAGRAKEEVEEEAPPSGNP